MAREAIELHLEGLVDEGVPIPVPRGIEAHRRNPDFVDGTWAVVTVDETTLRVRAKRINITMPERILDAVDRQRGETRSGLLVRAVSDYIGREREPIEAAERHRKGRAKRAAKLPG